MVLNDFLYQSIFLHLLEIRNLHILCISTFQMKSYPNKHKIIYEHDASDYVYANTLFDGGLNWNDIDFTGSDHRYRRQDSF